MSEWISVEDETPSQGRRVLLCIREEECLVVGYWGCGEYEVCTVNMQVNCFSHCYGGVIENNFENNDVTHWMPLPEPPNV